jgi:hypothetical protein
MKQVFYKNGSWQKIEEDGSISFVPNHCCKCMNTTDSQDDRFCDDCYSQVHWYKDLYLNGMGVWLFAVLGFFLGLYCGKK